MDIVFKAKHWQIFGIYVFLFIFNWLTNDNDPVISAIIYVITISLDLGWIMLLGYGLARRQNKLESISFRFFATIGILLIVVDCLSRLMLAFQIIETKSTNLWWTVALTIYGFISLTVIYSYPAKMIKEIETNRDNNFKDYFGDILRLFFLPFGIWTIQPRINKLTEFKLD